jgi:hypothetical protein
MVDALATAQATQRACVLVLVVGVAPVASASPAIRAVIARARCPCCSPGSRWLKVGRCCASKKREDLTRCRNADPLRTAHKACEVLVREPWTRFSVYGMGRSKRYPPAIGRRASRVDGVCPYSHVTAARAVIDTLFAGVAPVGHGGGIDGLWTARAHRAEHAAQGTLYGYLWPVSSIGSVAPTTRAANRQGQMPVLQPWSTMTMNVDGCPLCRLGVRVSAAMLASKARVVGRVELPPHSRGGV